MKREGEVRIPSGCAMTHPDLPFPAPLHNSYTAAAALR